MIFMAMGQSRSPEASRWLIEMAKDKSVDIENRKNAVFQAGQHRSVDFDALASVYESARGSSDMQEHVLFVISQRREPAAVDKLIDVAKNDPNSELKRKAIFWLGQKKNDPRAVAFIMQLLK
jgi:HEAT repeat protein